MTGQPFEKKSDGDDAGDAGASASSWTRARAVLQAVLATVGFGLGCWGLARSVPILYDEFRLVSHGVPTAGVVTERKFRGRETVLVLEYPGPDGAALSVERYVLGQAWYMAGPGSLMGMRYLPENPQVAHVLRSDLELTRSSIVVALCLTAVLCFPWVLRRGLRVLLR
ncbi:MAG: hypothetical protein HYZ53_04295 [Planctomycetes bacterium]|nr:hypothetical protein [Planctomycetota bacterium]